MLTSLICFSFAYCSMLRVLLPAICRHRSVTRVRMVLLSLRLSPPAAAIACVNIADAATFGDRSDLMALEGPDTLLDFQRDCSLQRGQVDRCRDRRIGAVPLTARR